MCVTNVYVDRYPDGKELEFRHTEICQYGAPGRPCPKLSTLENPVRNIQFGEPTTEYMMTAHRRSFPHTPPRSSGGSHHRRQSSSVSSDDKNGREGGIRRRTSERKREVPALRPTRTHRKERIIIVDSPPTPRTPPQTFGQTFSVPNSPASPPFIVDGLPRERGRPIIVDERPMQREREREIIRERESDNARRQRVPSIGAVVGGRRRLSTSRERFGWDSPSSSHTSFDSRARREVEEIERRKREREELEREREKAERNREMKEFERERKERDREREDRIAALEAERRREERIRAQDEEIRRRPAVPVPPSPPRRGILKPVVTSPGRPDPNEVLLGVGSLTIGERERPLVMSAGERAIIEEKEIRRRLEERDREIRERMLEKEEEAMKQRLKERQMPKRRFSVGPGNRRHRVLYDDGVYRWE
ncbi:uncharacterized protein LY89DRAFT_477154 [Mollisia scopiformis]|uniref:Uncharacterized protein n=1 Tax=Mollisia scopiformis TaxID=149040 RepID=A0A194XH58_MOLSC|nr:uncharacterized protein LY89DRAFT_477154 [Mollisia scopiformis]KUJ19107.1 hypothetical protein LY89DRAFT_477154 [Mollisia scopiformis]